MPPDDPNDFTPIDDWIRYTKGKNDAPVIKACNGNKNLLKFITVYYNSRVRPDIWAEEPIRDRVRERLYTNQPGYYDDDERFVAPDDEN